MNEPRNRRSEGQRSKSESRPLSVLICTRNRSRWLKPTLQSLTSQSLSPSRFELVAVNDASEDDTLSVLEKMRPSLPFPVLLDSLSSRGGPAPARKRAVALARGEILMFMGDDTLACPTLLESHLYAHREGDGARVVLGKVDWHRDLGQNSFRRFLSRSNFQFDFAAMDDGKVPEWGHFCTANVSAPAKAIRDVGSFDEGYTGSAWASSDPDLGYRLSQAGLKFVYLPAAMAYHDHPVEFLDYCHRMYTVGLSYQRLVSRVPPAKQAMDSLSASFDRAFRFGPVRCPLTPRTWPLFRWLIRMHERFRPEAGRLESWYAVGLTDRMVSGYRHRPG